MVPAHLPVMEQPITNINTITHVKETSKHRASPIMDATERLIVIMIILQVNITELVGEPTSGMTTLSIDTPNMPA